MARIINSKYHSICFPLLVHRFKTAKLVPRSNTVCQKHSLIASVSAECVENQRILTKQAIKFSILTIMMYSVGRF